MASPRLLINFVILSLLVGCSKSAPITKNFILMDTFMRIEIRDKMNVGQKEQALAKATRRMKELEKKFDYFAEDSELTMINNLKEKEDFLPSEEMSRVLNASQHFYDITDGAFDVRIGQNDKIDLGGIAKGYIVDEGIKVLRNFGIDNAIINAGGDMYCMGNGNKEGWKIGIRDPRDSNKVMASFTVKDKAVATSGGYERPLHIIDPRTKQPIEKRLKSVTVVADDCITADALATALFVLDPDEGLSIAESMEGTDCFIIDEDGKAYISSGFPQTNLTNRGL